MAMQQLRSALNTFRDTYYPPSRKSNFRETGELTPEEFVTAGDYLVYKFPSWSWSAASSPSKRAAFLPDNKQFLVTRAVPCRRRLGGKTVLQGGAELNDVLVKVAEGEEEWLSAGGEGDDPAARPIEERAREVKSVDESGRLADAVGEEEEIPDMEDEEDDEEAIIRDTKSGEDDEYGSRISQLRSHG
jgi:ubiquitin-like-conjugating enzyme ATG3